MVPSEQLASLANIQGMEDFADKLRESKCGPLQAEGIEILQINVGRKCNLTCKHCHVEAGPHRTEIMPKEILKRCLEIAGLHEEISTIDVTGGSPEMNPNLEWLIERAAVLKKRLIVRSNLVILLEEQYAHFQDVYAENKVEIVGSLPDYRPEKADRQRGTDFFKKSISVLQKLNEKGYAKGSNGLVLDLVHNPAGAFLPGSQTALEHEYRKRLQEDYDVDFNNLFCITNMPVGRYLEYLLKSGSFEEYLSELVTKYNPQALQNLMCRTTLSVGWDGNLYDCDFNQMLGLTISDPSLSHINDFDYSRLRRREIVIHNHCYGCTAGCGSSCQGVLSGDSSH
jgi:radical SAM/Cys-rich protein